jgi:hypothetical protein
MTSQHVGVGPRDVIIHIAAWVNSEDPNLPEGPDSEAH